MRAPAPAGGEYSSQELYGKETEEIAVQLATHFQKAGTNLEAADYLNQAGDRPSGMIAHEEAIEHYQQAIRAYKQAFGDRWDPLQQAILERKIGEAFYRRQEHQDALDHLQRGLRHLGHTFPTSRWGVRWAILNELVRQASYRLSPSLFLRKIPNAVSQMVEEEVRFYELLTMQYVNFIQKKFPHHELKIFDIASQIKKIEKDEKAFQEIMDEVRSSEGVLWAFPLYFFLVSSQYKRFIGLLWEKKGGDAFKNKYAALLTTSIHFFDHTAHNYMRAICEDLDMKFVGSFPAEMYDLLKEKERGRLIHFAENFFHSIETKIPTLKTFHPLTPRKVDYLPGDTEAAASS